MMLARVSYLHGRPDHDERTFDCRKCGNEVNEIVKVK